MIWNDTLVFDGNKKKKREEKEEVRRKRRNKLNRTKKKKKKTNCLFIITTTTTTATTKQSLNSNSNSPRSLPCPPRSRAHLAPVPTSLPYLPVLAFLSLSLILASTLTPHLAPVLASNISLPRIFVVLCCVYFKKKNKKNKKNKKKKTKNNNNKKKQNKQNKRNEQYKQHKQN